MDEDAAKAQAGCGCIGGIIALILAAVLGGYWRTDVTYTPSSASVNTANPREFEEDLNSKHFLGGLIQGEQPDLTAVIEKHVGKGKRLKTVTITTRHSIKDLGLMIVTATIYSPVTVTVKGTVEDVIEPAPAAPAATTTQ